MTDSAPLPPAGWYPDPDDHEQQRYWDGTAWTTTIKGATADATAAPSRQKTLWKAYLWWFPLGIFGAHHFYMGRKIWGWICAVTLNFLLIGWVVDGPLLPYWWARVEKDRFAYSDLKQQLRATGTDLKGASSDLKQAFGELGVATVGVGRSAGSAMADFGVEANRSMRLGGLILTRDKSTLHFGGEAIPAQYATVSVVSGVATSRVSASNLVGGTLVGGAFGHAGAGAVVGASARKNTTQIYIVVDFPGGQWAAQTSYKNEAYARRFAAKVNSIHG